MASLDTLPVEWLPIDRLKPYAENAKKHPPEQIEALAKSILRFKFSGYIEVDPKFVIIKGHGRVQALKKLVADGHSRFARVPCVVRHDLTPQEIKALRLADNQLTSTDYDTKLLEKELKELADLDFDFEGLGFSEKELEFLTADLGELNDAAFADDIEKAVTDQKAANDEKVRETDGAEEPVVEVLGFKKVTVDQGRKIRRFVALVEEQTGKTGADALIAFIDDIAA